MGPLHLWPEVPLTFLPPSSRPDSSLAHSCPDPYSPFLGGMGAAHSTPGSPRTGWLSLSLLQPRQTGSGSRGQAQTPPPGRGPPASTPVEPVSPVASGPVIGLSSKAGAPGAQLQKCGVLVVGGCPTFRCSGPFALPGGPGPAQVTSGAQRSSPGRASRAPESCSFTLRLHASASGAQAEHL